MKEYEDLERNSPRTPRSPCSDEELNTPLLRRIAQRYVHDTPDVQTPSKSKAKPIFSPFKDDNDSSKENIELETTPAATSNKTNTEPKDLEETAPLSSEIIQPLPKSSKASPKRRSRKSTSSKVKLVKRLEFSKPSSPNQSKITDFFGLQGCK